MSYSTSRLTLFAVLSSIETDLRDIILKFLEDTKSEKDLLKTDLYKKALERLEKDFGVVNENLSLGQLLPYIDFGDAIAILNANSHMLPSQVGQALKDMTPRMDKIVPIRNRVMHSRPLQFDDLAVALDISEDMIKSPDLNWANLKVTLSRLEQEPSFVLGLEIPNYLRDDNDQKHNLPIPDFDETGFLGRKNQVSEITKHCLGPYPVISIVGEGGLGKTALALKVAYDLLDMPNSPFEAIVWTSSKTTQLTAHEIVKIEGAICDSLGMFQNVADQLAGKGMVTDPLNEVLDYLREFKILLIMDNLETVLDERIRSFFERLPTGSKVLITSRIGLGAFEYPMKLQSMEPKEAVDLLRSLAKIRGVKDLIRIENSKLAAYCAKMKNSPGFIKWFVSAVQTGTRPEEVLAKPDIFLDFCMSNVYNYLSETGRKVLRSILCLPGKYSQAELSFLNDMEVLDLQTAVHELLRTNMVIMSSISKGSSFETQYEMSELARNYLSRHHPVEPREFDRLSKKKKQLVAAGEEIQAESSANPYSYYSLTMRSRSDLIVAKYLVDAMRQADKGNFTTSENLLTKARNLAPEYFEVHRVEAVIRMKQGNYSAALSAYEAAIDLEPESAPLRKWYGSFLVRYMNDNDSAIIQLNAALRIDPNSFDIQLELARVALFLRDFEQSMRVVDLLKARLDLSAYNRRKVYDLYLQCYSRKADHLYSQKDYVGALSNLEKLRQAYQTCSPTLLDERMMEKLEKSLPVARGCVQYFTDAQLSSQATSLLAWMSTELGFPSPIASSAGGIERFKGVIMNVVPAKNYGFILSDDLREFFFHRDEMINPEDWMNVLPGTKVAFVPGTDNKGLRATVVTVEGYPSPQGKTTFTSTALKKDNSSSRIEGRVVRLPFGRAFGFIGADDGSEFFFHQNDLRDIAKWSRLKVNDKVEFSIGTNDQGPCAVDIEVR